MFQVGSLEIHGAFVWSKRAWWQQKDRSIDMKTLSETLSKGNDCVGCKTWHSLFYCTDSWAYAECLSFFLPRNKNLTILLLHRLFYLFYLFIFLRAQGSITRTLSTGRNRNYQLMKHHTTAVTMWKRFILKNIVDLSNTRQFTCAIAPPDIQLATNVTQTKNKCRANKKKKKKKN